jgi:hypothetical protein
LNPTPTSDQEYPHRLGAKRTDRKQDDGCRQQERGDECDDHSSRHPGLAQRRADEQAVKRRIDGDTNFPAHGSILLRRARLGKVAARAATVCAVRARRRAVMCGRHHARRQADTLSGRYSPIAETRGPACLQAPLTFPEPAFAEAAVSAPRKKA